jgi:hypothetical protein
MLDNAAINARISYGRTSTRATDALYLPGRIHRLRKPHRKQPEFIKAAEAGKNCKEIAAEAHVGERAVRDVVEWGSLLVYSVLA